MKVLTAPKPMASVVRRQGMAKKSVAIRNRHIRKVVGLLLMMAVMALGFVWTRVCVIQFGYEVTKLHKGVQQLIREREKMVAEVANLKSPARLERIAQEHLGMRKPTGTEIIFVESKN
ncbi:MAG: cell division protein FtsL [Deltaproteobacteria bacterium]|nr:cell division protein FtsL [Deltaproteobacteria bacterium]